MKRFILAVVSLLAVSAPVAVQAIPPRFDYSINEFDTNTITITNYTGSGVVVVPDEISNLTVTAIGNGGDRVFGTSVTSVTLPDSVTNIQDEAFYAETGLTNIVLGTNVADIGYYTFYDCSSLSNIVIPDSVLSIGDYAFYDTALTNATIGANVISIGDGAFYECEILSSIIIPDSVTTMGEQAFYNCYGLTNITLGTNLTDIDDETFYDCRELSTITIPGGVTSIGEEAFYNCTNLQNVSMANSVTTVGYYAFESCYALTNVTLSTNLTSLSDGVFYYCYALANVTIPSGISHIPEYAFYECESLQHVVIPNGVTSIEEYAFYECDSLQSLTLPASVADIEDEAFYECEDLTNVTIPSGAIGYGAFEYCYYMTNLTIGDGVTSIGDDAFYYCEDLQSITIPKNVTRIGIDAFYDCEDLTNATILGGSIGNEAFEYCYYMSNLTIGDGVTSIGDYAFYYCEDLTSVTIPKSVTSIGEGVFEECYNLSNAVIANNAIGAYQFDYCYALQSVTITGAVSNIVQEPFWGCSNLTQVYFQGNAPKTDFTAFKNTTNSALTVYYLAGGTGWGNTFNNVPTVEVPPNSLTITLGPSSAIAAGAAWQLDGGPLQTSPSTTLMNLLPGSYTVAFTPIAGWITPSNQTVTISNQSATVGGFYIPTNAPANGLIVLTNGPGIIDLAGLGKTVVVGKSYKITAIPNSGALFVGWTGGTNQPFPTLAPTPALTFKMQSNLVLIATFVTNPFIAVAGTYNGLFTTTNGVAEATSGMLSALTISTKGSYSGKLLVAGASYTVAGSFDTTGAASNNIVRKAAAGGNLTVNLVLSTTDGTTPMVAGSVSGTNNGASFAANVTALKAANALPTAQYTMLILPDTNNVPPTNSPGGDGYAAITYTAGSVKNPGTATAKIAGALADGTAFSQTVQAAADGSVPVYANLSAEKGLLLGWINLTITNTDGVGLTWIHGVTTKGIYTNGFTNVLTADQIPLSLWTTPPTAITLLTNLSLVNVIGDTNALSSPIAISATGKITGSGVSGPDVSGSVTLKTGVWKATVGSGTNKYTGYGAILLDATNGGGYFTTKVDAGGAELTK